MALLHGPSAWPSGRAERRYAPAACQDSDRFASSAKAEAAAAAAAFLAAALRVLRIARRSSSVRPPHTP